MKPGNQIILLRPDDIKSGPTKEWVQQFADNLTLIFGRYQSGGAEVQQITPKEKDSKQLLKPGSVITVLFNQAWLGDANYTKLIEQAISEVGDGEGKIVVISTSSGRRQALGGKLEKLASFVFYDHHSVEAGSDLMDETMPVYWSKLLDLVLDLGQTGPPESGIIYLAETEVDISDNRDVLRRELNEQGYRIVPDTDLAGRKKELKSYIQKNVDQSRLAIHLLGNHYGEEVENESVSISELQVRYISEYLEAIEKDETLSSRSRLSRLIWVDPDFNPQDKKQADFVEELKRNIEKLHRTEIVQNPLELFKTLVINKIKGEDSIVTADESSNGKLVYIIHQKSDEQGAGKLARSISAEGVPVGMLDYNGTRENMLKDHKNFLKNCDAVILYYETLNRPWIRAKIMDLQKAPGYGRTKNLVGKQLLATGKDKLDDFSIPGDISVEKDPEPVKALSTLIKLLKQ